MSKNTEEGVEKTMFETITYEIKENIGIVTLNRPEFGNAFSEKTYSEFQQAMEMADTDSCVRSVVVTGKGKLFCAGGDVRFFEKIIDSGEGLSIENVLRTGGLFHSIKKCSKPVIAAVNGAAAGAGAGVALACDFIIMGKRSKIVPAFINMAFSGDTLLLLSLQRAIGVHRTARHVMLDEPITSSLAQEYGLSYEVVEDEEIIPAAMNLAAKLAKLPTKTLGAQKQLMRQDFYPIAEKVNQLEAELMHVESLSDDHKEAVAAFIEKREPDFTGE